MTVPWQRLSIVIPTVDGFDLVSACLATLPAACTLLPWEVVVVDNGSADGGVAFATLPGTRVVHHATNLGFARGVNSGIRAASGDVVMVLNNDTLCAPGMIDRMLRALAGHPGTGLVAPLSNLVKAVQAFALGDEGLTVEGRRQVADLLQQHWGGRVEDVEDLSGLCLLGTKAIWNELGGFDEEFPVGNFEDDDLCLRARRRGHRLLVVRDAYLHHLGNRTFRLLGVDYWERFRENERIFQRKWQRDPAVAARVLFQQGQYEPARVQAQAAVVQLPRCPEGHRLLADCCLTLGQPGLAIEHYQRFLACCPRHGQAALNLGFALLWSGDEQAGCAQVRRAILEQTLNERVVAEACLSVAETLLDRRHPGQAQSWLACAQEGGIDGARLHRLLGLCALLDGRLEEAETWLGRALSDQDAVVWMNLGITQWRRNRPEQAVASLRRACAIAPDYAPARQNLELALSAQVR
jgi:GT2 family glycosyltransferase